ncbi:L-threonylcarbamoyladenylate synthase [Aquirufa sp. OSTEICH-129V]|uniref:Threonylcarbamoyl-AMP synthase n=1 Tax=Aquirufa avitistagni TaxID=3104728 RepID=A0ABW6DEY2_9BACT
MITTDITLIRERLNQGELIGLPTETVYGLAANVFNSKAVANIFTTKQRPTTNPLIVHVASISQARALVKRFPEKANLLAKQFWPGPLTLILPKNQSVSHAVTANQENVAIRIPNHPAAINLLNQLDFPLVAPSANPFNRISPTTAAHVDAYFPSIYTLDGGACQSGVESTIVGFEGDEVVLLRHGAISIESIEDCVGRILNRTAATEHASLPGQHKKHYAPSCELIVTYEPLFMLSTVKQKKVGILWYTSVQIESIHVDVNLVLAPTGDLAEAAKNLFAALHTMDQMGLDLIIVERLPAYGLGITINDRLDRAATK